jgi:hypothetical protein
MKNVDPISYLYDFATNVKYPVYFETDLIINNPVFIAGKIIMVSPTYDIDEKYLRCKVCDGIKSYNEIPFIDTTLINPKQDNSDLQGNYKITVDFDINEALMLSRICRNTIIDNCTKLDNMDKNDTEAILKINTEISLLKECRNKIKKSINAIYGEKAKNYTECEE